MKNFKSLCVVVIVTIVLLSGCNKHDFEGPQTKKYSSEVALSWIRLQMDISKSTAGFNPGVTGRSFGYSCLALYESVVPGMPQYQSVALQFGAPVPAGNYNFKSSYYWPASANAAMAYMIRNLFANTTPANFQRIDSLENALTVKYTKECSTEELDRSVAFGRAVATSLFEWSKTDGGHQGYLNLPTGYIPPSGPGFWVPTPPAFAPAALPYMGSYRSFVKDIAANTPLPAPTPYSEDPKSPFFQMMNEVYTTSLTLTKADTTVVRFWADLPGQFNGPAHFTSVVAQLVEHAKMGLDEAALTFAKHGIVMNDAGICCFKQKYFYNAVRPITYIRSVFQHPNWNAIIPTPPHPEYPSAHATIMQADATVMAEIFGAAFQFTDNTFADTYGARTYTSFDEYAKEGTRSRILGGIHVTPSGAAGIDQGKRIGAIINRVRFKK